MTITFSPEVASRATENASRLGTSVEDYVSSLVREDRLHELTGSERTTVRTRAELELKLQEGFDYVDRGEVVTVDDSYFESLHARLRRETGLG